MNATFSVGNLTRQWASESHIHCWYQSQTTSTNEIAKAQAFTEDADINSEILYVTDHQTQGRGRGTNTWKDNGESSYLLTTWSLALQHAPQPITACRLGLAVYRSLKSTWNFLDFSIKAPNDIFLNGKKIAGLLIENLQEGSQNRLLLGLGMNVFAHPGLPESSCLAEHLGGSDQITALDWKHFLERLRLEILLVMQNRLGLLTASEKTNLLSALNQNKNLTEHYTQIESNGTLQTATQRISWMDL